MALMEFAVNGIKASTASLLRLVRPWLPQPGHHLFGDSAFASVYTCGQLLAYGWHFTGMVKTATRLFPRKALVDSLERAPRGTHSSATTVVEVDMKSHDEKKRFTIRGVGWLDKVPQTVISTCLSDVPGVRHLHGFPKCLQAPSRKPRFRLRPDGTEERYTKDVPRPKCHEVAHEHLKVSFFHEVNNVAANRRTQPFPPRWSGLGRIVEDAYLASVTLG